MKTNFIKTLFVTLFLLSVNIVNAHDFEVDGIYYNITDATNKTVAVTYSGSLYSSVDNEYIGSVVIPESVSYNGKVYCVTSIGYNAFEGCDGLTSATIGNSVTSIGAAAFYDCDALTSITISNSVTSIGDKAFIGCYGLKEVHINDIAAWCNIYFDGSYANPLYYAHNLYLNNELITELVIPNSVTSIGDGTFSDCKGLTSITIPNSVTSIGSYAFNGCSRLTSVTIGNSVTRIGHYAFNDCSRLESIIVEDGNTKYDSRENCNAIIETESNTLIAGCKNTVIPNSVTSIGSYAFNGCSRLRSIEIPNSVTNIGNSAFSGCSGLTSITIPNSVKSIGYMAFYYCSGLTSITIPNSVTSIESRAFDGCSGLTSITIPNSVTCIGESAFEGCKGLKTVVNLSNLTLSKGSSDYGYVAYYADKVINDPKATFVGDFVFSTVDDKHTLVAYLGKATEITLPDNYNGENYVIGDNAFRFCSGLTSITIPNSVTSIGESAFSGCSGLTSITIPNSVTSIGYAAFLYCSGLKTVVNLSNLTFNQGSSDYGYVAYYANKVINDPNGAVIGDYVFSKPNDQYILTQYLGNDTKIVLPENSNSENYAIGANVFNGNTAITSLTIPNSVTSIGNSAFRYCSGLKTVINLSNLTFTKGSTDYGYVAYYADKVINAPNGAVIGDYVFSKPNDQYILTQYLGNDTKIVLPENCNGENYAIGANVFNDNTTITSVTIPNSVTSIGDAAFFGCSGLTSIEIPNSVTSIGNGAFWGTLWYENLPNGVVYINNILYKYKGDMPENTSIEINEGTVSISDYAFEECSSLTSIEIPKSVTYIGRQAFEGCSGLTSIEIPNSVTSIGDYAFYDCSDLTSIEIPNSVTSIGDYAFLGCFVLTNVTIGKGVINMGGGVFDGCPSITTITLLGEIPPVIINTDDDYEYDFTPQQYETVVLYVPEGSLDVYKSAYVWKEFFNIKEFDNTGIENLEAGSFNGLSDVYYDLNGCIVDNPTKGIYIINGKKVLVK